MTEHQVLIGLSLMQEKILDIGTGHGPCRGSLLNLVSIQVLSLFCRLALAMLGPLCLLLSYRYLEKNYRRIKVLLKFRKLDFIKHLRSVRSKKAYSFKIHLGKAYSSKVCDSFRSVKCTLSYLRKGIYGTDRVGKTHITNTKYIHMYTHTYTQTRLINIQNDRSILFKSMRGNILIY